MKTSTAGDALRIEKNFTMQRVPSFQFLIEFEADHELSVSVIELCHLSLSMYHLSSASSFTLPLRRSCSSAAGYATCS